MSYLLLAELGFISHYNGLKKYFLESLGKSLDYSVLDLNRSFIKNASRITSKYLKHKDTMVEFYEKLSAFVKEVDFFLNKILSYMRTKNLFKKHI